MTVPRTTKVHRYNLNSTQLLTQSVNYTTTQTRVINPNSPYTALIT